jgi:serine/threonine protein kinase/tetratricopeptide (TPR) repeat protein
MGQVWSGTHVEHQLPVAIKFVSPGKAGNPRFHESFRTEVRAVARLSHPGVVSVYDHGLISQEVASAVGMHAGSPYLVMEYTDGGTLADLRGELVWSELVQVLQSMLSALAHAHARGVIHRDLKPANVLVRDRHSPGQAPEVVIIDFGLAHALEGDQNIWKGRRAVGTPGYMAPEQIDGRWRDYGPWTDLYSLGRVVRYLIRPKPGAEFMDVPEAFLGWIQRMLTPDPSQRFRRAADAARVLAGLGEIEEGTGAELERGIGRSESDGDSSTAAALSPAFADASDMPTMTTMTSELPAQLSYQYQPTTIDEDDTRPIPEDWRSNEGSAPSPHLIGAGLGLYGLRTISVVGRHSERDHMWSALKRVHDSGRAELLCLRGASGNGKTRLTQWLCERAHEEGVGTVLHGYHGSIESPHDGLAPMLQRYMRAEGLSRSKIVGHLGPRLRQINMADPDDWLALTELISPAQDTAAPTGPVVRFGSASERHHLVARLLAAIGRVRTAIVWIDDVQWGLDSLYFARQLLNNRKVAGRTLVVLTVREEALPANRRAETILDDLVSKKGASELSVGPLEPNDRQTLVRQLLGLEETLATRVESVSAGNPLFAVQVVGEWVQRGLLERGDGGFRLRPGVTVEVPDDLHQVWAGRIARILDGRPKSDQHALELAAVLGEDVDAEEWKLACHRAGARPSSDLLEALLEQKLARAHALGPSQGWSFVHGMLRESLERMSRDAGSYERYNRICAWIVAEQDTPGSETRTGRHLLAAGELEQAVALLTTAAQAAENRGDSRDTRFILGQREEALDKLEVGEDDYRRLEGWLLWAHSCRAEGRLEEALDWAQKVITQGKLLKSDTMLAEALLISERVARFRGEAARAWRRSREAERLAATLPDPSLLGMVMREQGWILIGRGNLEGAEEKFRLAISIFEGLEAPVKLGACYSALAVCNIQAAQFDIARSNVKKCLELVRKGGSRTQAALALSTLGDIERMHGGDLDKAEELYRSSVHMLSAAGYGHIAYAEMNLGLVLVDRGNFAEAESFFESALESLLSQDVQAGVGVAHAMLSPCAAARSDFEAFDAHLDVAEERLGSMFDADVANPMKIAGDLAAAAGESARAKRAYELSLAQWKGLGREAEIAAVQERLTGCSRGA